VITGDLLWVFQFREIFDESLEFGDFGFKGFYAGILVLSLINELFVQALDCGERDAVGF
jgi:hypothetical protein